MLALIQINGTSRRLDWRSEIVARAARLEPRPFGYYVG